MEPNERTGGGTATTGLPNQTQAGQQTLNQEQTLGLQRSFAEARDPMEGRKFLVVLLSRRAGWSGHQISEFFGGWDTSVIDRCIRTFDSSGLGGLQNYTAGW